jgi:hypothetical protein
MKHRNPKTSTSTKSFVDQEITPFQSFGYRELEESRVETPHHRSLEVTKCETPKSQNKHINKEFRRPGNKSILEFQIPGVGGVKSQESSSQESRSCKIQNTKILRQTHQQRIHFRVSQTGKSKIKGTEFSNLSNSRYVKSRNAKMQNRDMEFWGSQHGASRYLITRIIEIPKCRNAKNNFWCRFRIPGVGVLKHFTTGMPKW